mmetsp:Transcript_4140/g.11251  ORF Transcript_4140/g.11251 Transcript_4140/m.11251 type:complete len:95 (-) Transcript_4140:209-493(-)
MSSFAAGPAAATGYQAMPAMEVFNSLDANGDGVISRQEFHQAMQRQHMQGQQMQAAAPESYDLVTVTPHGLEVTPLGNSRLPPNVPLLQPPRLG